MLREKLLKQAVGIFNMGAFSVNPLSKCQFESCLNPCTFYTLRSILILQTVNR